MLRGRRYLHLKDESQIAFQTRNDVIVGHELEWRLAFGIVAAGQAYRFVIEALLPRVAHDLLDICGGNVVRRPRTWTATSSCSRIYRNTPAYRSPTRGRATHPPRHCLRVPRECAASRGLPTPRRRSASNGDCRHRPRSDHHRRSRCKHSRNPTKYRTTQCARSPVFAASPPWRGRRSPHAGSSGSCVGCSKTRRIRRAAIPAACGGHDTAARCAPPPCRTWRCQRPATDAARSCAGTSHLSRDRCALDGTRRLRSSFSERPLFGCIWAHGVIAEKSPPKIPLELPRPTLLSLQPQCPPHWAPTLAADLHRVQPCCFLHLLFSQFHPRRGRAKSLIKRVLY